MPPFIVILVRLMLGVPGVVLWILGGVVTGFLGLSLFTKGTPPSFSELGYLCGSAVVALLGYLMVVANLILGGGARYRIAGDHVPELIAMEIGLQAGAMVSFCAAVGLVGPLVKGDTTTLLTWLLVSGLALWGTTRLYLRLEKSVGEWEADFSDPLHLRHLPAANNKR